MPHTPGPWEMSPSDPCRVNVAMNSFLHPYEPRVGQGDELDDEEFHDDWNICQCNGDHYSRPRDECVANARLIAAAPDLLAALEAIMNGQLGGNVNFSADRFVAARDAIARVRG